MPRWRASRAITAFLFLSILSACGEGEGGPVVVTESLSPHKGQPITILYSHGAGDPGKPHKCDAAKDIPKILANMRDADKVKIRYLCSDIPATTREADYINARVKEIEHFLFKLRAEGIPARNIFLMGYMEGAWASLIAARRFGKQFNAVVAFAPVFHGVRGRWAKLGDRKARAVRVPRAEANQITELSNGPLRAMVYIFKKDTFNGPRQLAFLRHVPGLRLIVSKKCEEGHKGVFSDCFADWEKLRLRNYLKKQLAEPQVAKTVN